MSDTELILDPGERGRRFWTSHGRTVDELTILHAFCTNLDAAWTAEGLCIWYGIRVDRARRILSGLRSCGIVNPVSDGAPGSTWNATLDWAAPRSQATRQIVQQRWLSKAALT
jgi:hypothetical protein